MISIDEIQITEVLSIQGNEKDVLPLEKPSEAEGCSYALRLLTSDPAD